jgi:ribosomal protein S18 acetylase RimI-like enzyme
MDKQIVARSMSTANEKPLVVDIQLHDAVSVRVILADIARLYEAVYQEPPYCEGPDDVAAFIDGMPRRTAQPGFRLVTATVDGRLVGFAFGHQLASDTKWWNGAITPLPKPVSREYPARTFAIIELAVDAHYRRRGIAKMLHDALLADASEERATLLVRPEAVPAHRAYERWGYVQVGSIRPWADAPVYDAMVLTLRAVSQSA